MRSLASILVVVSACGGSAPPAAKAPAAQSSDDATSSCSDALGEIHESLAAGDANGILPMLGAPFMLVGPGADQVYTDKSTAVVALDDAWHDEKKHKLKAHDADVHVAKGGRSAWAIDQGTLDGKSYVATAVLTGSDELWLVDAAQIARPVKEAPGGTPGKLPAEVAPGAQPVVDLFDKAITTRDDAIAQLADDAVLVEGSGKIVDGADAIEKRWTPPEAHHKKKKHHKKDEAAAPPEPPPPTEKLAIKGEPRAGLTPDGALAWVCADVDVTQPDDQPVPHRFFYVYEKAKGDAGWRLVALHEATFPSPL